ncbi:lipoprotein [Spiroplasma floricola]|uniref:Lipoprotein n=1 Tax=Spiroplasma floricola 23-6 TaxID=1336749 RepID=A0A2K8SEA0_9MOLU|nr:lipoprotein [Spiroplasma floricola]AUB31752.1 hypothetical protein SFLOR_v1c07040 [Spiroplasma floricola 23-6]
MKKLLSMLAVFGITSSATVTVVACGTKSENKNPENKPEQPKEDLNKIIKDFKDEATNIYIDHIKNEVMQNLIGIQESEKKHLFIKKDKITAFSNKEKELTLKDKKDIEYDENLILNSTLLAQKLNELKKVNKYKVILDDIDFIFDGVEIIYNDNLKIKSGELSQGVYIGNFINEYKVNIKYKGKNSIEKFEIKDILKYTSTDDATFKLVGDNLVKNTEKDFLVSNEMRKYSNFEWNNIKGNKQTYEGFGDFSDEIKKYINSNDEYKKNLIDFIKQKYFTSFQNLNLEFSNSNIYLDSKFKTNLLNVFENKSSNSFENYISSEASSEKIFKAIFRNDPNSKINIDSLKELYFTKTNIQKWNKELLDLKNNYLKDIKMSQDQITTVQKTNEFNNASSIGNVKIKGVNIIIGTGENKYNHELPDFNLSITYNASNNDSQMIDYLSEFTSKEIIKEFHNFYGIDSNFKYPEFNSNEDYLMNIGDKNLISNMKKYYKNNPGDLGEGYLATVFWTIIYANTSQIHSILLKNIKTSTLSDKPVYESFFININDSNNLFDYASSRVWGNRNNKITASLNDDIFVFTSAKGGAKDKNPDSITFKLGYLAVNFKYEKLFKLSENQDSKAFVKFKY